MRTIAIVTAATINLLLAGCIQVGPKEVPVSECPKLKVPECPKCPTLAAPVPQKPIAATMPAIDQTVTIKIRGDNVEADAGGEKLLRAYVQARKLLQSQ